MFLLSTVCMIWGGDGLTVNKLFAPKALVEEVAIQIGLVDQPPIMDRCKIEVPLDFLKLIHTFVPISARPGYMEKLRAEPGFLEKSIQQELLKHPEYALAVSTSTNNTGLTLTPIYLQLPQNFFGTTGQIKNNVFQLLRMFIEADQSGTVRQELSNMFQSKQPVLLLDSWAFTADEQKALLS